MQFTSRVHYPLADSPLLQSPKSHLVVVHKLESYIAIAVIDDAVTSKMPMISVSPCKSCAANRSNIVAGINSEQCLRMQEILDSAVVCQIGSNILTCIHMVTNMNINAGQCTNADSQIE